jgi:hypothetical protein
LTGLRRLLHLPHDFPVRALSAEFGLDPVETVFSHRRER